MKNSPLKSDPNKRICIGIGVLQALHLLLYLTGWLDRLNVSLAFGICAIVSVLCTVLSVWLLLPFSKFQHGIKYLLLLISVLQVLGTIVIFLLPEAGIPPLIQFSGMTK